MTSLIQVLTEVDQPDLSTQEVDYVAWATEKFRNEDGTLNVAKLAEGKWKSDVEFIPQVTRELQNTRNELQTRASLADFMVKYEADRAHTNTPVIIPSESQASTSSSIGTLTQADIDKIVEAKLNSKQNELVAQANYKQVADTLKEKWGSNIVPKLEAKARELGVGVRYLESIALNAPKAFLELVLDKVPASPPIAPGSYTPPRTNTNTNSVVNTGTLGAKTRKQWNDERKKMSSNSYWTPEIQNRILADKVALGDKFDK